MKLFQLNQATSPAVRVKSSAARFCNLEPVGLLFEPFGNQYFDLATMKISFKGFQKFGYFLLKLSGSTGQEPREVTLALRIRNLCYNSH